MEFTPRIQKILQIILMAENSVTETDIAKQIGVSKRTIQREMDYIETGLQEYQLELKKKKNIGVSICGNSINLEKLQKEIEQTSTQIIADKEARRKYLICELLRERVSNKLFYFSNMFGVSESTISKDLESIEEWFEQSHLQLIRRPGFGIILSGSEKNYRLAIQKYIHENVDSEVSKLLVKGDGKIILDVLSNYEDQNVYGLINSEILGRVSGALKKMHEPRFVQMTEDSYIGLIMHTAIALDRIMKGETLKNHTTLDKEIEQDMDYDLAKRIVFRLEKEFQLKILPEEVLNILLHIKGAKVNYSDTTVGKKVEDTEKIIDIVEEMIDVFDSNYAFELKNDETFLHGLLIHLRPTMIRLRNGMNIHNPLLDELREEYKEVFAKCKQASTVIEKVTGYSVPDAEVGFLTMHFEAALVRVQDRMEIHRNVEIGVICASGFGLARLMTSKLKNSFSQNVTWKTYGKEEISPYIISKTDFFVSSINYDELDIDSIKISPLVTKDDLQQIQIKIEEYSHMPEKNQKGDFTRQLDEINLVIRDIKHLIKSYKNFIVEPSIRFEELIDKMTGKITSDAENAFVLKNDLASREKIMSQIFPEMGFALLHCRTKAVRDSFFYTVTPSGGLNFLDASMKGIKVVIILLMPMDGNIEKNKNILGFISSSFIEDDSFLKIIFEGEEEQIREKLKSILKKYFNEYIVEI